MSDHDVNAQVKLLPINQQRITQVLLHNVALSESVWWDILELLHEEYATAFRAIMRLDNVSLFTAMDVHVTLKGLCLVS